MSKKKPNAINVLADLHRRPMKDEDVDALAQQIIDGERTFEDVAIEILTGRRPRRR